ncbi:MAG TPA: hypothetical protein VK196_18945 [Magnetospirillum sp.]|nr:hypothetical protein [Magnetospirillum sp.]
MAGIGCADTLFEEEQHAHQSPETKKKQIAEQALPRGGLLGSKLHQLGIDHRLLIRRQIGPARQAMPLHGWTAMTYRRGERN